MHYHLEIIMPPTDDIEAAVRQIMAPFNEHLEYDDEERSVVFWDFWVIGGRWSGEKLQARYDAARIEAFIGALKGRKITVSGLQAGKQEIKPPSQIPEVDALWREHFPDGGEVCPLFKHYNDQYVHSPDWPDVMRLEEIPERLSCERVIIAGRDDSRIIAVTMRTKALWNGVNYETTDWDGKISSALADHVENDCRLKYTPRPDWLVVTVDYHS